MVMVTDAFANTIIDAIVDATAIGMQYISSPAASCHAPTLSPTKVPVISNLIIDTDGIKLKISTEVLVEESLAPTVGQSVFA